MRIFNQIQRGMGAQKGGGGCRDEADIGCRLNSERQLTNY